MTLVFKNARYLEKVIKYDRRQPEFIELTEIYVNKRATKKRDQKAQEMYLKNKKLFDQVEKNFFVDKELLLAFWGIETNFGRYVGKTSKWKPANFGRCDKTVGKRLGN